MNLIKLRPDDRTQLHSLDSYPAVVAVPASFRNVTTGSARDNARGSSRFVDFIDVGKNARVVSDVYIPRFNRIEISVLDDSGLVQTYFARMSIGFEEAKNARSLHVKFLDLPYWQGSKPHPGKVMDRAGKTHRVKPNAFTQAIQSRFYCMIKNLYQQLGIPDIKDWAAEDQKYKRALDFEKIQSNTWNSDRTKRSIASDRLLGLMLTPTPASDRLSLEKAVKLGLLPDYPEMDVPYSMCHCFDTSVHLKFMGLLQQGGAPNNTLNVRTANRISIELGEPVSHTELLSQLQSMSAPCLGFRPGGRIYCLAVVQKKVKEVK